MFPYSFYFRPTAPQVLKAHQLTFTYRQKYQKIRKRDAAVYDMEDASSSNPTTPRSNKRKSKHAEDMDDEELMQETPIKKKAKTEKAKRVKKEFSEYAGSEWTTVKLDSDGEDDPEMKSEGDIEA